MNVSPAPQSDAQNLREILLPGLSALALRLDDSQCERLLQYIELLAKWNKVYNLTAVREPSRMVGQHILDSLSVISSLGNCKTIVDVGTGAGLPGIPLAIAVPVLQVTLLDTVSKKTAFVRHAIGELSLGENAVAINARVEDYQPAQPFDAVISRAFADIKDFVVGAGHLCKAGGRMFAMKGVYPHDEIARMPGGFSVESVVALTVPAVSGQRHLVVIRKT